MSLLRRGIKIGKIVVKETQKVARFPHKKMEGLRKKGRKFKKAEDDIFKRFKKDFPKF